MRKNTSGQTIGAQIVSATDGSAFTGAVTVAVTGDAGTQATGSVGSGACVHEGNGFHTYAPAQAETDYDHVAFTFTGTGAVPATVQVFTSFPQSADHVALIAAVQAVVDAVAADTQALTAASSTPAQIAAAVFTTAMTEAYSTAGGTVNLAQFVHEVLAMLQEFSILEETLTTNKRDGATPAGTFTLDDATSPTAITRAT